MKKVKILMVEDDKEIAEILKKRLEREEYEVILAFDGEAGFKKFISERPDMILLDVQLPKMSGYEVCRKIRIEYFDKTPIIMLTGLGEDADKIVGRVRGADVYITKPFKIEKVLHEITNLLKRENMMQNGDYYIKNGLHRME